jgi:glycerophosphoryl diester phosphodiesterase
MKTLLFSFLFLLLFTMLCCRESNSRNNAIEKRLQVLNNPYSKSVLVTAHRAFHTTYPENSLAAIRHSIELGIDMVELDVRQTKDGVLILMHDHTVNRTTKGKGEVKDMTLAEVKKLVLKKSDKSALVHLVPTLQEVLLLVKDRILVDIDIKNAPVKKLFEIVKETKTENQVLFFQHHNATHDSVIQMDPSLKIVPRAGTTEDVVFLLKKYQPGVMQIPPEIASTDLVGKMKKEGCTVWINALGDADDLAEEGKLKEAYSPLIELGATIIQSDRPDLLLEYLKDTGRHW